MASFTADQKAYAALAIFALSATAILVYGASQSLPPFFGPIEPVAVIWGVCLTGFFCVRYLDTQRALTDMQTAPGLGPGWLRPFAWAFLAGALFALPTIIADLAFGFPDDINVRFPWSVLHYPTMALVAETTFHLLPFALFLLLTSARGISFALIAAIALIEPAFQLLLAQSESAPLLLFTGIHLYIFNVAQLLVFRSHGFLPMYAMRIGYYLVWHIVWGELRLLS